MLYSLDGIVFEIAPLNVEGFDRTTGAEVVEKAVIGVMPLLEYVGPTGEEWSFRGTLFAGLVAGGLAALEVLRSASSDGVSRHLQRGDGANLGWWKITQFRESGSRLDRQGVAKVSSFDLTLKRAQAPAGVDYRGSVQ